MDTPRRDQLQTGLLTWANNTFGTSTASDPMERIKRFAEEAIELMQAARMSKEDLLALVDYVYARPVGEIAQEVGGVAVSLLIYCELHGLSADALESREAVRIMQKDADHFRARQSAKAAAGIALPNTTEQSA